MYNPLQLLRQEPAAIKAVLTAIFSVLIIRGTIVMSPEEVAGWALVTELALGLLWVRQTTVSKDGLRQLGEAIDTAPPIPPPPVKKEAAKKRPALRRNQ